MRDHLTWNAVLGYLAGPSGTKEPAHLETGCTACAERVDLAQRVLEAVAAGPLPLPSADAVRRAVSGVEGDSPSLLGRVRELLGSLVSPEDCGPIPALRGTVAPGGPKLYEAGPFDVDILRLEKGTVVGQILAREPDAPELTDATCLLFGEAEVLEVELRSQGEFHFPSVRAGKYGLVLEAKNLRILLPEVDLT